MVVISYQQPEEFLSRKSGYDALRMQGRYGPGQSLFGVFH